MQAARAADSAWRVVAASATGSAHVARGLPCQDAWGWRRLPAGQLLAAVADGAGSAARAELGAALAVDAVLEALARRWSGTATPPSTPPDWRKAVIPFDAEPSHSAGDRDPPRPPAEPEAQRWLREAVAEARAALVDLARELGCPLRDLSCTLTCIVAEADRLWVGQIGDGLALARDPSGVWHTVGRPQKDGEYANEARFLTAADALEGLVSSAWPIAAEVLVASSDGLLRLMLQLPGFEPHPPFVEPLVRFAAGDLPAEQAGEQLARFLAGPRIGARTDDDTTLLIALRAADAEAAAPGESAAGGSRDASPARPVEPVEPGASAVSAPLAGPRGSVDLAEPATDADPAAAGRPATPAPPRASDPEASADRLTGP